MRGNRSGKVFISHASKDKNFVDRLVSDLAARGVPVWYDKLDVRLGDSIPGKINSGISEAKHFLIVLSPAAVKSKWVQEELNAALMRQVASAGTFLLPVLVEDRAVTQLLGHRRFANFREDYEAGLEELLEVFGRDTQAAELAEKNLANTWPDPYLISRGAVASELAAALRSQALDGRLWTAPKVARWIAQRTGRSVHETTAWRAMRRLGFKLQVPRPRHRRYGHSGCDRTASPVWCFEEWARFAGRARGSACYTHR
jgi:hypothetical protein